MPCEGKTTDVARRCRLESAAAVGIESIRLTLLWQKIGAYIQDLRIDGGIRWLGGDYHLVACRDRQALGPCVEGTCRDSGQRHRHHDPRRGSYAMRKARVWHS